MKALGRQIGLFQLLWLAPILTLLVTDAAAQEQETGEAIYFRSCALCHGGEGEGAMPDIPDLTKPEGPLSKSTDTLVKTVVEGVERPDLPTPMPPFGGDETLTEKDLYKVLTFMKQNLVN